MFCCMFLIVSCFSFVDVSAVLCSTVTACGDGGFSVFLPQLMFLSIV